MVASGPEDAVWQLQPAAGELVENLGGKDVVGEGKTAVSAGGGGMLTLNRRSGLPTGVGGMSSNLRECITLGGRSGTLVGP